MKTLKIYDKNVTLTHVTKLPAGHGHWKIICYFEYSGVDFSITATTNDMPSFDEAMAIENYTERQIALYNIVSHKIEDAILEKIYDIDEDN